jgi:signal transduction histidine kinase
MSCGGRNTNVTEDSCMLQPAPGPGTPAARQAMIRNRGLRSLMDPDQPADTSLGQRADDCSIAELQWRLQALDRLLCVEEAMGFLAHELAQPLGAMLLQASACQRMLETAPPECAPASEMAGKVVQAGREARSVLEQARQAIVHEDAPTFDVDLNRLVYRVLDLEKYRLAACAVETRLELSALPTVSCEPLRMTHVLRTLVSNAIDACCLQPDDPVIVISSDFDPGQGVVYTVRNPERGFRPEDAEKVFQPFYSTHTGRPGLGLSTARRIVEDLGGRMWVDTAETGSVAFCFQVPAAASSGRGPRRPDGTPQPRG